MLHSMDSVTYNELPSLTGLVLLIGPPGAGKSTFAKQLVATRKIDKDAYISNDVIAKELFGVSVDRGDKDGQIFAEQDRRVAVRLTANKVAVVDATNVKPEARQRLIAIAQEYLRPVTALCFHRDTATLLAQNRGRDDAVPPEMVMQYATLMQSVTAAQLHDEGIQSVFEIAVTPRE